MSNYDFFRVKKLNNNKKGNKIMESANYNFKRFVSSAIKKKYCGISKGERHLHITRELKQKLNADRVAVYFDLDNLAILIRPARENEEHCYSVGKKSGSVSLANKTMPNGKYKFVDSIEAGLVCVFENTIKIKE